MSVRVSVFICVVTWFELEHKMNRKLPLITFFTHKVTILISNNFEILWDAQGAN